MSNDKSWDVILAELARVQQRDITNQIVVAFADINNRCYQMMSHTQETEQTPKTLKRKDPEQTPFINLDMQSFRIPDSPSFDCVKSVVREQIDDVAYRNHTELLSFAKRMYKKKGRGVVVCHLRVCSLKNSQKPKLSLEPIVGQYYRTTKFEREFNNAPIQMIHAYNPLSEAVLYMLMEFPDEWKARYRNTGASYFEACVITDHSSDTDSISNMGKMSMEEADFLLTLGVPIKLIQGTTVENLAAARNR
jgi:hypothetical protein